MRSTSPKKRRVSRRAERGAVYVEILVVILPLLTFIFGIFQLAEMLAGRMLLDHAAFAAARSASVMVGEDPKHGGGNKEEIVKLAAVRAIAPYALDGSFTKIDVQIQGGAKQLGAKGSVEITATYQCHVPLVWAVLCETDGKRRMRAKADFASSAARYQFE
jgi:Flp pilus assembly protein TadG